MERDDLVFSGGMARTASDIETRVIERSKARGGKSLARRVMAFVAKAFARRGPINPAPPGFRWISQPMGARVDLADKEAVYTRLDSDRIS